MIFKIHSKCNLNCKYCYMYNKGDSSYKQKPNRVSASIIMKIPKMLESERERSGTNRFTIAFHGGEPLLVGKSFFADMMAYLRLKLSSFEMQYTMQTNAVLIDDEWIKILADYGVTVAASIDGPAEVNGLNRVFHSGKDSSSDVIRNIVKLRDSRVNFAGVICVAQPYTDGKKVVQFIIDELRVKWFDILLPDFTHDTLPVDWHQQQESLLQYMINAFNFWYMKEDVKCRIFDNIMAPMLGYKSRVETIGVGGLHSMIIETDGTLEPHDGLRICEGYNRKTGVSVGEGAIERLRQSEPYAFLKPERTRFCTKCLDCSLLSVCQSGHLMHRYSKAKGFENPSVHCYVLYGLIDYVLRFLNKEVAFAPQIIK